MFAQQQETPRELIEANMLGGKAGREGFSAEANPYEVGTRAASAWLYAWAITSGVVRARVLGAEAGKGSTRQCENPYSAGSPQWWAWHEEWKTFRNWSETNKRLVNLAMVRKVKATIPKKGK